MDDVHPARSQARAFAMLVLGCALVVSACSNRELIDPESVAEQIHYVATCGAAAPLSCDAATRNQCTTMQTSFRASDYSCLAANIDLDGGEWVAPLITAGSSDIVITTGGASDYAFVAVLRDSGNGPQPSQCITGNYYSVRLKAGIDFTPGDNLYVVVDHASGANVAFDVLADCHAGANETSCADGFDQDADYQYDCVDPDCNGSASCPECAPRATLACGDKLVTGNTGGFGSTNLINGYTCMPTLDTSGREYAYVFQPTSSGPVVFDVSNSGDYPILAVVRDDGLGCMTGSCVAGSYYSVRFDAVAGETYYLIVDGEPGKEFSYNVSVLCNAPTNETACSDGIDNDGDWYQDCEDSDCATAAECKTNVCTSVADLTCSTRRLAGNTSSAGAQAHISQYSCMPQLSLGNPEVAYKFRYDTGPASQKVLLTLSNETSYATVAALNDVSQMELSLTLKNTTTNTWSSGLLTTRPLITPGAKAPRPGQAGYNAYTFVVDACDVSCGAGCSDDGNATVLAQREGLTIGVNAWLVPSLAPGQNATISLSVPSSAKLSYIARIQSSSDDYVGMHVIGNPTANAVPLADANGNGLDAVAFAISGYDVNSRSATDGSGSSCSSVCPPPTNNCYVAYNNGTTGGSQGGQTNGHELQCNPNQCIAGNYYGTTFTAARGVDYYVTVEGSTQTGVGYELSVLCNPSTTETNCSDQIDDDGDNLIDCFDPDCNASCMAAGACTSTAEVTCSTFRLAASTTDAGARDAIDSYLCSPISTTGAELTFHFTAERTEWVNFTTGNATDYAVVSVLEDTGTCDPFNCVATQYYSSAVYVEAGKSYFVVVDGINPSTFSFELSVVCNPAATETQCGDGVDNDGDYATDCNDPDCPC